MSLFHTNWIGKSSHRNRFVCQADIGHAVRHKQKRTVAYLVLISLVLGACTTHLTIHQTQKPFGLCLTYGIGLDEINTFRNTISKHIITDSVVTVPLALTDEELAGIEQKLTEIDLFSYPDTFVAEHDSKVLRLANPHSTYRVHVTSGRCQKTLFWEDTDFNREDPKAIALRGAFDYIIKLIESKREYRQLPRHAMYY
jgi:hypothetical protein